MPAVDSQPGPRRVKVRGTDPALVLGAIQRSSPPRGEVPASTLDLVALAHPMGPATNPQAAFKWRRGLVRSETQAREGIRTKIGCE